MITNSTEQKQNKLNLALNFILYGVSVLFLYNRTVGSNLTTPLWGSWSYSEYLISYPNTFVRRGLFGEILLSLSKEGDVLINLNIFLFTNFIIYMFLMMAFFLKMDMSLTSLTFLNISSFGILNFTVFNLFYHRKEALFLNFFILFLILFVQKGIKKDLSLYSIFYLLIVTLFTALTHEGMLLIFSPFYFYIFKKHFNSSALFSKFYVLINFILFGMISIINVNKKLSNVVFDNLDIETQNIILSSLGGKGAIAALDWNLQEVLIMFFKQIGSGQVFFWIYPFFLGFFTLYILLYDSVDSLLQDINKLFSNRYLLIPFSVFILGWDWGRWIIILILIIFLTISLEVKPKLNISRKPLIFLFIILSTFTVIPECCLADDYLIFETIQYYFGLITN